MTSLPSPAPEYIIRCDKGEITALQFGTFQDEEILCLLTGHSTGALQIWDLKIYRPRFNWIGHCGERVQWVGWLPHNCIISQGRDGLVKFWKIGPNHSPECTDALETTCYSHCQCALGLIEPLYLAVPQESTAIDVLRLEDKNVLYTVNGTKADRKLGTLMCCKLVKIENELLTLCGYENGSIVLWDSSGTKPLSLLDIYSDAVMCFDYNEETMRGIAGGVNDKLVIWKIDSITQSPQMTIHKTITITNRGIACVCVHPYALYVAVACWDNSLRIFSWKSMKPLAVLNIHADSIGCLAFSRTFSKVILAAGSRDCRVSLWNLYNDKLVETNSKKHLSNS